MHCIRTISALRRILPVLALLLASGPPLVAEDAAAEAAAPAPDWKLELGLSYLATSGNSETASGGLKATASKEWDPWSLEAGAYFLRAEDKGETTAERYGASIGGARALSEHWGVTAGWSGEKDRFSGIDFRSVLSAGTQWKMLESESWKLDSRAALTWTTEDFGGDLPSNDYLGGLLGLNSAWKLTSAADLTTKLVYFPNFD
ncbi:MAG: DUF481 domain-containing protein, partial [Acidobacteria bacterium]|nr:DUF481 domain-containing protein [Acidobacteriota bacterium]